MLDDIDIREKTAHPSYKDKEQLDFQILLTENYYMNPNNIHNRHRPIYWKQLFSALDKRNKHNEIREQ